MSGSLLFILVGPSGAGKTTLMKRALQDFPDLRKYVTCTTREPRPGEVEGQDYHFISRAEFEQMRAEHKLVECQEFFGALYGSSYTYIEKAISGEVDRITSTEVLGAETLQGLYPESVVTIFVSPPSLQAVRERRAERARETPEQDTPEQEALREERMQMELDHAGRFKYALVNGDLEEAVRNVEAIIRAERCLRFVRQIRQKGLLNLL
jgi:guanylate kinase